jgi:hypothetical protein
MSNELQASWMSSGAADSLGQLNLRRDREERMEPRN